MKVSYVRQHVALAVLMACASLVALSAGAIEWSMLMNSARDCPPRVKL